MSLPLSSVPRKCPGEKAGLRESRMSPPVGLGIGATSGRTKQAKKISAIRVSGATICSLRSQARWRTGASSSGMAIATARTSVTAIADPRIEHGIEHVGRQVGEHRDDGEY